MSHRAFEVFAQLRAVCEHAGEHEQQQHRQPWRDRERGEASGLPHRRRDGTPGLFEKIACAIVLMIALAIIAGGFELALSPSPPSGPPGPFVLFALGGLCLLAGVADLRFILRGKLSATQRISRHLWRMCFAFFIATGSFFLGQQDVLPEAMRGSPFLFVLAFAPFALMFFWLVRIRFPGIISRLKPLRAAAGIAGR